MGFGLCDTWPLLIMQEPRPCYTFHSMVSFCGEGQSQVSQTEHQGIQSSSRYKVLALESDRLGLNYTLPFTSM